MTSIPTNSNDNSSKMVTQLNEEKKPLKVDDSVDDVALCKGQNTQHTLYRSRDADQQAATTVGTKFGVGEKVHTVDEQVGITGTINKNERGVTDKSSLIYYSLKEGNPLLSSESNGQGANVAKDVVSCESAITKGDHEQREIIEKEDDVEEKHGEMRSESQSIPSTNGESDGNDEDEDSNSGNKRTLEIVDVSKSKAPHKARLGGHKKRRVGDQMVVETPQQVKEGLEKAKQAARK